MSLGDKIERKGGLGEVDSSLGNCERYFKSQTVTYEIDRNDYDTIISMTNAGVLLENKSESGWKSSDVILAFRGIRRGRNLGCC